MQPIVVGPNQPGTFYRGSGRLADFRGEELALRPEDWVASTTSRFGAAPSGLTALPDGTLLLDAIAADPVGWLGAEHVARHGASPALLVKLLDAGQRLPVHVHPSRQFARSHLVSPYGKTEAWVVLDAAPDASVHLGFARDVSSAELAGWVATQDVPALLGATNVVPVSAGDVVLCPAGVPHAIGENILLVEVQEPTDFSVLLEWDGFGLGPADATLGLPLDLALTCVDRRAFTEGQLVALRQSRERYADSVLPAGADMFFSAARVAEGANLHGFGVLVVTGGSGELTGGWGSLTVRRGNTVVVPFGAGACHVSGEVAALHCRPAG